MSEASHQGSTNRLLDETSPYLLQHARNPVDWYPWGPEALARAQAEDRPILLSVGYSACHWCHVMAHESFEDPEIAALMNEHFVNIKVDREERPDIDAIYMEAVQAMTGRGGWPMTVFLTPDGKPFYGGTYYPPMPRHGLPGFGQLLAAIADAWRERRAEMTGHGDRLATILGRTGDLRPSDAALDEAALQRAAGRLLRSVDRVEGGVGGAPKFPQPMNLDFLMQHYLATRDQDALAALTLTLTKMARGGIYDQLGGGFHRYSTDEVWLVPHFEKMLYDNAQLARTYLHAWQVTGEPLFRRITEETLDYVLREMTSPEGGFYSTQDADSEGHEGKFFLWGLDEVRVLLGEEDGHLFAACYGVTERGNFREGGPGANILHAEREVHEVAVTAGVTVDRLEAALARGRQRLVAARAGRIHPGRDEKVLAEWNGLMISALAEAGVVLDRPDYLAAGNRAADFLLASMVNRESAGQDIAMRLTRTYKGGRARLNAYLEDYAAVALGLLALHQATFEVGRLETAVALTEALLANFTDPAAPGLYQTSADHERLVARRKDFIDSATPSGNSLAAELLLLLGRLLGREEYLQQAEGIISMMVEAFGEQPGAFGRLLGALSIACRPGPEVALVGAEGAPDTLEMLRVLRTAYLPGAVVALIEPGETAPAPLAPLLKGRVQIDGRATAYVCRQFVCGLPVTEPSALAAQLAGG